MAKGKRGGKSKGKGGGGKGVKKGARLDPEAEERILEEVEEEDIEKVVEKEAEEFRKGAGRRRSSDGGALTPSTMTRTVKVPVKRTWKPGVAGIFLIVVSIIGIVTSSNLLLTANDQPLYASDSGALKGFILGEDGEALVGAHVTIDGTSKGLFTSSDGKYKFPSIPRGERTVVASYPGHRTVKYKTLILGGTELSGIGDTNLTLPRLAPQATDLTTGTASLTGTVHDTSSNAERNATVTIVGTGKNATTDANGRFDLGDVPMGYTELTVVKSSYMTKRVKFYMFPGRAPLEVVLNAGSGEETQDLTDAKATVTGTVLLQAGGPPSDALVESNGTAVPVAADGTFTITVDAGEVTITAGGRELSSASVRTYVDASGTDVYIQVGTSEAKVLRGDTDALKSNLMVCGAVIIGMSLFILFTGISSLQRKRFWVVITGSLFGSVFMLVTFQFGIILGLLAFGLLLFSRREFE